MNTNNQPEDINPERIAELLTHSAEQLDDKTVAALRGARSAALERQSLSQPVFALSTGRNMHWLVPHSVYQWASTIILLAVMIFGGASYWTHMQEQEHDMSHLDVAILIDDLPLEVFVD